MSEITSFGHKSLKPEALSVTNIVYVQSVL